MNSEQNKKRRTKTIMSKLLNITTVVGGRPRGSREFNGLKLSLNIDYLLTRAALNESFKKELMEDPIGTCERHGFNLSESEKILLSSMSKEELEATINSIFPPMNQSRRRFMKAVPKSIVALITGRALLELYGCPTGITTEDIGDGEERNQHSDTRNEINLWINLASYRCYLYVPNLTSETPLSLTLLFHAYGETSLEMIERVSETARTHNTALLSVNWSGNPEYIDGIDTRSILEEFKSEYSQTYNIDTTKAVIMGYKEGGSVALVKSIFQDGTIWKKAASYFGVIPQKYKNIETVNTNIEEAFVGLMPEQLREEEEYLLSLRAKGVNIIWSSLYANDSFPGVLYNLWDFR